MRRDMSEHEEGCKCEVCKNGIEAYKKWEAERMAEYGWIMHGVVEGTDDPDVHTHGVPKSFGHPDLQIKIRGMGEFQQAGQALSKAVEYIKDGGRFTPGVRYHDLVVENMTVTVRENEEGGRTVLLFTMPE
jgi:hypothetical protein